MLTAPRRPMGNLLASAVGGRGDLSADTRMMGATQARAPMGSAPGAMPGRGQMLADLLTQPDNSTPGQMPMTMPLGPSPSQGRGHLIASALGGDPFAGAELPPTPQMDMSDMTAGDVPIAKPGFFDSNGGWRNAVGILGDALAGAAGRPALYAQSQMQKRKDERDQQAQAAEWGRLDRNRTQDRGWAVEDRDAKLKAPQFFMSGRDRVQFDPTSQESSVVYDGPEDYQTYAETLGLDPADDGYQGAVQDYVLRGNGPTSQRARQNLETQRLEGRLSLKATPTYAATHPRARSGGGGGGGGAPKSTSAVIAPLLQKMSRGIPLTPAEQAALDYTRPRGGRGNGSGGAANVVKVSTPAEAQALPPGTRFRTPDGKVKIRP